MSANTWPRFRPLASSCVSFIVVIVLDAAQNAYYCFYEERATAVTQEVSKWSALRAKFMKDGARYACHEMIYKNENIENMFIVFTNMFIVFTNMYPIK